MKLSLLKKRFRALVAILIISIPSSIWSVTLLGPESFEAMIVPPVDWTQYTLAGHASPTQFWELGVSSIVDGDYVAGVFYDATKAINVALETPSVDLSGGLTSCKLSFYGYTPSGWGGALHVEISTDTTGGSGDGTWSSLAVYDAELTVDNWEGYIIDLNSYIGEPNVHIRFRSEQPANGNNQGIDLVEVYGNSPGPSILSVEAFDGGGAAGVQAGDSVIILFDQATNEYPITLANINSVLSLSGGAATWGDITAEWLAQDTLRITFNDGSGSIAVTDTVSIPGPDTIESLTGDDAFTGNVAMTGSFDPPVSSGIWGDGITNNGDPFNAYYHDSRSQSVYLASELMARGLRAGSAITAIDLHIFQDAALDYTGGPRTEHILWDFRIRMKHTSNTTSESFETDGWIQVFGPANEVITETAPAWHTFTFDSPFVWNGVDNIYLDLSRDDNDYASSGGGGLYVTDTSELRTHSGYVDDISYSTNSFNTISNQNDYLFVPEINITSTLSPVVVSATVSDGGGGVGIQGGDKITIVFSQSTNAYDVSIGGIASNLSILGGGTWEAISGSEITSANIQWVTTDYANDTLIITLPAGTSASIAPGADTISVVSNVQSLTGTPVLSGPYNINGDFDGIMFGGYAANYSVDTNGVLKFDTFGYHDVNSSYRTAIQFNPGILPSNAVITNVELVTYVYTTSADTVTIRSIENEPQSSTEATIYNDVFDHDPAFLPATEYTFGPFLAGVADSESIINLGPDAIVSLQNALNSGQTWWAVGLESDTAVSSSLYSVYSVVSGGAYIPRFNVTYTVDTTPPVITAWETQDVDQNGKIDAIKITFDESIRDASVTATDFDVAGYVGESFDPSTNGDIANNNVIFISFNESANYDTNAMPAVTYTQGSINNGAGLLLASTSTAGAADAASPVLISASSNTPVSGGVLSAGTILTLVFSEPIAIGGGGIVPSDFKTEPDGSTPAAGLDGAGAAFAVNAGNLEITLTSSTSAAWTVAGEIDIASTPALNFLEDAFGNDAVDNLEFNEVPIDNLLASAVAWWQLNGNGDDSEGGDNNANLIGGVTTVQERHAIDNGALELDGTTGFLQGPDGSETGFPIGASNRTVCAWINLNSLPVDDQVKNQFTIFRYGASGTNGIGFSIGKDPIGDVNLIFGSGGAGNDGLYVFPNSNVLLNAWNHVCASYDGTNVTLYLNGKNVSVTLITGGAWTTSFPPVGVAEFGIGANPSGAQAFLKGKLDDVRLYSYKLSNLEIVSVYNTKKWDGGAATANWSDGANWVPDGVPYAGQDVILDHTFVAGAYTVNLNSSVTVGNLEIDAAGTTDITLSTNAQNLTVNNHFDLDDGNIIGGGTIILAGKDNGNFRFAQTSGTINANVNVNAAAKTYELSAATTIGGSLTVSEGTLDTTASNFSLDIGGGLTIGDGSGAAVLTANASAITVDTDLICDSTDGTFTFGTSTVNMTGSGTLRGFNGSCGFYKLNFGYSGQTINVEETNTILYEAVLNPGYTSAATITGTGTLQLIDTPGSPTFSPLTINGLDNLFTLDTLNFAYADTTNSNTGQLPDGLGNISNTATILVFGQDLETITMQGNVVTTGAMIISGSAAGLTTTLNTNDKTIAASVLYLGVSTTLGAPFNANGILTETGGASNGETFIFGNVDIHQAGSQLSLTDSNWNVSGSWLNSAGGTFSAGTGTVSLNGTGTQSITGSNTFNNLTIADTGSRAIYFANGQTQTVSGTFTADGTTNGWLYLRSDSSPTQWTMALNTLGTLNYIDVQDGVATGTTPNLTADGTHVDSTNNTGWFVVPLLYSRGSGDWDNGSNWSFDACGGVQNNASLTPDQNYDVVICDEHTITVRNWAQVKNITMGSGTGASDGVLAIEYTDFQVLGNFDITATGQFDKGPGYSKVRFEGNSTQSIKGSPIFMHLYLRNYSGAVRNVLFENGSTVTVTGDFYAQGNGTGQELKLCPANAGFTDCEPTASGFSWNFNLTSTASKDINNGYLIVQDSNAGTSDAGQKPILSNLASNTDLGTNTDWFPAPGTCQLNPGDVVINEIMPYETGAGILVGDINADESYELYNKTSVPKNLSNCILSDGTSDYAIPAVTTVSGTSTTINGYAFTALNKYLDATGLILPNGGGTMYIYNETKTTIIDQFDYTAVSGALYSMAREYDGSDTIVEDLSPTFTVAVDGSGIPTSVAGAPNAELKVTLPASANAGDSFAFTLEMVNYLDLTASVETTATSFNGQANVSGQDSATNGISVSPGTTTNFLLGSYTGALTINGVTQPLPDLVTISAKFEGTTGSQAMTINPPTTTFYSTGGGGNWSTASVWVSDGCGGGTPAGVAPGAGENAVICSGDTVNLNGNRDIHSLTIEGGTLNASNFTLGITGNFQFNSGIFNANTSTISFICSTADCVQNINNNGNPLTFFNLDFNNTGNVNRTIYLPGMWDDSQAFIINGAITASSTTNYTKLRSTDSPNMWRCDLQGTADPAFIQYLDIKDGKAFSTGDVVATPVSPTNSLDSGNTIGWFAPGSTTYYSIDNRDWADPRTWSTVGCGGAQAANYPGASDNVVICQGTTVTLADRQSAYTLLVGGGASAAILNLGSNALEVTGSGAVITIENLGQINSTGDGMFDPKLFAFAGDMNVKSGGISNTSLAVQSLAVRAGATLKDGATGDNEGKLIAVVGQDALKNSVIIENGATVDFTGTAVGGSLFILAPFTANTAADDGKLNFSGLNTNERLPSFAIGFGDADAQPHTYNQTGDLWLNSNGIFSVNSADASTPVGSAITYNTNNGGIYGFDYIWSETTANTINTINFNDSIVQSDAAVSNDNTFNLLAKANVNITNLGSWKLSETSNTNWVTLAIAGADANINITGSSGIELMGGLSIGAASTFAAGTSTLTVTGNDDATSHQLPILTNTHALNNLTLNNTVTGANLNDEWQLASDLTLNGSLNIIGGIFNTSNDGGTNSYAVNVTGSVDIGNGAGNASSAAFTANASAISVRANWTTNATDGLFTAGTSTVTLNGANGTTQTITGSTTFNNLTILDTGTANRTLLFKDGDTFTVNGAFTATGSATQNFIINTDTGSGQFTIDGAGTATADYVDVSNSTLAVTGTTLPLNPTNFVSTNGNTIGWFGNLVAHWTLDNALLDSSLTANSLTDPTSAGFASDRHAKGNFATPELDGSSQYYSAPGNAAYNFGTGDFSVGAWIKTTQDCTGEKVFVGAQAVVAGFKLSCGDTGQAHFSTQNSAVQGIVITGTSQINDGKWRFLFGTKQGKTVSIYVDGKFEASSTFSGTLTGSYDYGGTSITIGKFLSSYFASAQIDDVKIYNYARSAEEVLADYNTKKWEIASAAWNTAANWVNDNEPTVVDGLNQDVILDEKYLAGPYTVTLDANKTIGSLEIHPNVTLDLGGFTLTVNEHFDMFGGTITNGTVVLVGTTDGPFRFNHAGGTITANVDVNAAGKTYELQAATTIGGNLTITNGTLNAGTNAINLAGNWTKAATGTFSFTAPQTVTLNGTAGTQAITGSTTFNNLTLADTGARTITFPAGGTQTVGGTFTADATTNGITIDSSDGTTQSTITVNGTIGATANLNVSNNVINGTAWSAPLNPTGTPGTNTVGWYGNLLAHWKLDGDYIDFISSTPGTAVGTPVSSQDRHAINDTAYKLDGATNAIDTNIDINNSWQTTSVWAETSILDPADGNYIWVNGGGESGFLTINLSSDLLQYYRKVSGVWQGLTISPVPNEITNGGWHHFVVVDTGSKTELYIDGKLAVSDASGYHDSAVGNLSIGYPSITISSFKGSIDELRVYNYALTSSEILSVYNTKKWEIASAAWNTTANWVNDNEPTVVGGLNQDVILDETYLAGPYTVTLDANKTVGSLEIHPNVTLDLGGFTLTVNEHFDMFGGTITNGTVVLAGTTDGPFRFNHAGGTITANVNVNAVGKTYQLQVATTIGGNLTITQGTLNTSATNYALTVSGNVNIGDGVGAANTAVFLANSSTITVGGSWVRAADGQFTSTNAAAIGSTVIMSGTGTISNMNTICAASAPAVYSNNFFNLSVAATGQTTTVSGINYICNQLTLGNGALTFSAGAQFGPYYGTARAATTNMVVVPGAQPIISGPGYFYFQAFSGAVTIPVPGLDFGDTSINFRGNNGIIFQLAGNITTTGILRVHPMTSNNITTLDTSASSYTMTLGSANIEGNINSYNSNVNITGNLTFADYGTGVGNVTTTGGTWKIGGNYSKTNTGTTALTGSTFIFNGTANQTVTGSTNFASLTLEKGDGTREIQFKDGDTFGVSGTLTIDGQQNGTGNILIRSQLGGTPFNFNFIGTRGTLANMDVKDANNTGTTTPVVYALANGTSLVDSTGNTAWFGPLSYYSMATGVWSAGTTWSADPCGGAQTSVGAAPDSIVDVVICDGHTVTLDVIANAKNLQIGSNTAASAATLDTSASNFALNVTNSITIGDGNATFAGSAVLKANASTITLGTDFTRNTVDGQYQRTSGNSVEITGSGTIGNMNNLSAAGPNNFYNLTVASAGNTTATNGNTVIHNQLTTGTGTFNNGGWLYLYNNAGSVVTTPFINGGATLSGTIVYYFQKDSNGIVSGGNYGSMNMIVYTSDGLSAQLGGSITTTGGLRITGITTGAGTLNTANYSLNVKGLYLGYNSSNHWGILNAGNSNVTVSGGMNIYIDAIGFPNNSKIVTTGGIWQVLGNFFNYSTVASDLTGSTFIFNGTANQLVTGSTNFASLTLEKGNGARQIQFKDGDTFGVSGTLTIDGQQNGTGNIL
ncbi:MAG: hypothetical protein OEZ22_12060, partial [Spirochaetia bacterium]|nr:hypothetical protein [Spirochaetia bacterium]